MQTEVQETKSLVATQLSQDLNEQQFNPTIDSQDQMVLNTGVVESPVSSVSTYSYLVLSDLDKQQLLFLKMRLFLPFNFCDLLLVC